MAKERGLRSSNDAKAWRCRCGNVNRPTKHRFFDLPAFRCRSCRKRFNGSFKFCLGEIEVEGGSLIGEVQDQKLKPYCVAYAYCKAVEILERICNVNNDIDPDKVERINPHALHRRFEQKFPEFLDASFLGRDFGIHKVLHMGLILREEGIQREQSREMYKAEDLSAIARDDFEEIARLLAEGVPLVATYRTGKRKGHLKYCQIYKSPPLRKGQKYSGHAVVLIGAGMKKGRIFFYFLSSWGDKFCPRKNIRGEIKMSGIGKLRERDLTKNVIKLSQPHKTDSGWRLEAQNESDISKNNYFLMMATKKQYAFMTLRKAKLAKLQVVDEKANSGEQQCDQNDFEKIREDHLDHGPFCDDEASEDRYDELEACSTEIKEHVGEECLCDIRHHDQLASAQTDHTIHSVRGVAQAATSSAPAATSHRASRSPSSGPAGRLGYLDIGFGATETATATATARPLEGLNMLWHMYETVQGPFLCTTTMSGEHNTGSNPSTALLGNQGSNQPSNPATIAPSTSSESTTGTPAPNTNPVPNPWSTNAGGAQGETWSAPAGNIRNGVTGGLGGLGSADMGGMLVGLPDTSPLSQIVQNPAMIQNFMSDPQSMNQLLSIIINARNRVESNKGNVPKSRISSPVDIPRYFTGMVTKEAMAQCH